MRSSASRARAAGDGGQAHRAGGRAPGGQHDRRRRAGWSTTSAPCARRWSRRAGRGRRDARRAPCTPGRGSRSGPPRALRIEPHAREHGPLPFGREGQGRARASQASRCRLDRSLRRLPRISRMSARSFPLHACTSRGRVITPCVDHFTVRTCWRITPLPEQGKPLWAERLARVRPHTASIKAWAWRGVAAPGVCRRACFSPPPPREDGARSSVVKTPGSVARFRVDPNCPWPSPSTYPSRPL